MSDKQDERKRQRKQRQANRKQNRDNRKKKSNGDTPDTPGAGNNPPTGGNQGGHQNGNQNGNQGNQQGGNQGNTPPQQRGPIPNATPDFDGQSHAYNFNLPHGKPQNEEKAPKKGGGGEEHKPYKPEGFNFKYDKKLIMEWLDEMFQKYFLAWPLEKITDWTIIAIDWFLYAPFSGGGSEPEAKKTKNKTILDYRDDVRDEYAAKADIGLKVSSQAHKELKDNIEKASNGLPTTWREWGGEPACFRAFVELAQKAAENPNSPEAKRWKEFERYPEKMRKVFQKEDVLRYFSLTLAAADAAVNPGDMEIPKNVSKKINEMSKIINKSSDIVTLKNKLAEKINECRALTSSGTPINVAIAEKIDEIQNIISGQGNDVDKIKKDLNKKIKELKNINAFPKKIKANSQAYYDNISENIDKILEVYSAQPETAAAEVKKYVKQIKDKIDNVEIETQKYVKEGSMDIKKLRRNRVKKRIEDTKKAIDQFDLGGTPINQRQQASERHPCLLSAGKRVILNSLTKYVGS